MQVGVGAERVQLPASKSLSSRNPGLLFLTIIFTQEYIFQSMASYTVL